MPLPSPQVTQPTPPTPQKRGGCRGCAVKLLIPVFLLVLCAGCLLISPLILRALDLIPPTAEELYSGANDPIASAKVGQILKDAGIEGAQSYVLPIKGTNKQLAVITFDNKTTFEAKGSNEEDGAIMQTIMGLSKVNESGANVDRTVLSYHDRDGNPFFAFTAAQADIEKYANKEITRAEFLARVDGNLSGLTDISRVQALAGSLSEDDLPEFNETDAKFAAEAAVEWVVGKNLVTTNCPAPYDGPGCELRVNAAEVTRWQASQNDLAGFGLGLAGQRSMSQEAATALGAAKVAATLAEADGLAEQGLAERNQAAMDQAVSLRPDDWSLRDRQAALLMAEGDSSAAAESLKDAEDLVNRQVSAGGDCQMLQRNLLQNRTAAFTRAAELNPNNRAIGDQLVQTQNTLAAVESGQDAGLCR